MCGAQIRDRGCVLLCRSGAQLWRPGPHAIAFSLQPPGLPVPRLIVYGGCLVWAIKNIGKPGPFGPHSSETPHTSLEGQSTIIQYLPVNGREETSAPRCNYLAVPTNASQTTVLTLAKTINATNTRSSAQVCIPQTTVNDCCLIHVSNEMSKPRYNS